MEFHRPRKSPIEARGLLFPAIPRRIHAAAGFAILLSLSACGATKRIAEQLPTPPERLACEQAGTRPTLPPEYAIDWAHVLTVPAAKIEHDKFVSVLRNREGLVAGYILKLEGVNFTCWNNMEWRRQYEAGIAPR